MFASSGSAQAALSELRTWGAHGRITMKRATAEEGKR